MNLQKISEERATYQKLFDPRRNEHCAIFDLESHPLALSSPSDPWVAAYNFPFVSI
jgi:hypothetical protein